MPGFPITWFSLTQLLAHDCVSVDVSVKTQGIENAYAPSENV